VLGSVHPAKLGLTMAGMFGAAKRKNSLVGVATVLIVALVAMCIGTSAAMASYSPVASTNRDAIAKSRAEIFFKGWASYVGGAEASPANALGKYDCLVVVALECTSVRKGAGTSGTLHYYHRNQQYSINAVTTSTGAVAERYAYSAYGEPTTLNAAGTVVASTAIANRYTYTGREWDSTVGLYHFRARWISPKTGRFLGRDPIGYAGSEWMLTEALESCPLGLLDPSGESCCVRTWKSGGKAGHTAIKCGNHYFSKWPAGSSTVGSCKFNTEAEDIASPYLGSKYEDFCLPCLKMSSVVTELMNQITNCVFCALGSNCTNAVNSILKAGLDDSACSQPIKCPCPQIPTCRNTCGLAPLFPAEMGDFVNCLKKLDCKPYRKTCEQPDTGGTVF
jgi:RHS repeat-associated protein